MLPFVGTAGYTRAVTAFGTFEEIRAAHTICRVSYDGGR